MEGRRHDPPVANRRKSLWRTMSVSGGAGAGGGGDNTAKAIVAEQISQTVQSTSNLLHLMQQSSPAQAKLVKLPKNLLEKVSTIKNTEQVLEQLPRVISSLDAHMENGLQNVPHLKTVVQLLANMESSQLSSLSRTHVLQKCVWKECNEDPYVGDPVSITAQLIADGGEINKVDRLISGSALTILENGT